jgi:phosphate transport system protein
MPQHTDAHYERELQQLNELVLRMGGLAERAISKAIHALVERDSNGATEVIQGDEEIDQLDVEIDEHCLRLVALHQPAASDLRFITTALKVTVDIERIGDQAVNISKRVLALNQEPVLKPYIDLPRVAEAAEKMVHQALDSLVRRDVALARQVIEADVGVDRLANQIFRELLSYMVEDPKTITRAAQVLFVSRHLERIADHATNIAEMVIFMVEGKMVRHKPKSGGVGPAVLQ